MKVINQYVVTDPNGFQILIETEGGKWFLSDVGAFGQRDFRIKPCREDFAKSLIVNSDQVLTVAIAPAAK